MNTSTPRIEVRTSVLATLLQISRDEGLNRQVEAIDLSTTPPTTWGDPEAGVLGLPTDADQRAGAASLHKLVMMLWEHHAFGESLIPHCRVQAVVQLVGGRPLVSQLDIPLEVWLLLELDAASQRPANTVTPGEVTG